MSKGWEAVGVHFGVSIDKRIDGASSIIGHKPSTRQDIEMKRPLRNRSYNECNNRNWK